MTEQKGRKTTTFKFKQTYSEMTIPAKDAMSTGEQDDTDLSFKANPT